MSKYREIKGQFVAAGSVCEWKLNETKLRAIPSKFVLQLKVRRVSILRGGTKPAVAVILFITFCV